MNKDDLLAELNTQLENVRLHRLDATRSALRCRHGVKRRLFLGFARFFRRLEAKIEDERSRVIYDE